MPLWQALLTKRSFGPLPNIRPMTLVARTLCVAAASAPCPAAQAASWVASSISIFFRGWLINDAFPLLFTQDAIEENTLLVTKFVPASEPD
jgi:hypothetical protein